MSDDMIDFLKIVMTHGKYFSLRLYYRKDDSHLVPVELIQYDHRERFEGEDVAGEPVAWIGQECVSLYNSTPQDFMIIKDYVQ